MKWYVERIDELKKKVPVYSVCGDNCAVCPRYLAKTAEELHETAVLWYKVGWRDHVVSNAEIACTGCGCRPSCAFMLLPCQKQKGVTDCKSCSEGKGGTGCAKIQDMLSLSKEKETQLEKVIDNEELLAMLKRAFYEKEKNLGLK